MRAWWLLAVGLVVLISACTKETPATAIYALAHNLEHENIETACERLYPGGDIPDEIASALSLTNRRKFSRPTFRCTRALSEGGDLDSFELIEPRVHSTTQVATRAQAGITAAAIAEVAIEGESPVTVKLVEFRGTWRVVVDVDAGRLA